jgi:hypothetical protein
VSVPEVFRRINVALPFDGIGDRDNEMKHPVNHLINMWRFGAGCDDGGKRNGGRGKDGAEFMLNERGVVLSVNACLQQQRCNEMLLAVSGRLCLGYINFSLRCWDWRRSWLGDSRACPNKAFAKIGVHDS